MGFKLEFKTDNAAFHEDEYAMAEEVSSILKGVAEKIAAADGTTEGPVRDTNGNTVGKWSLTED